MGLIKKIDLFFDRIIEISIKEITPFYNKAKEILKKYSKQKEVEKVVPKDIATEPKVTKKDFSIPTSKILDLDYQHLIKKQTALNSIIEKYGAKVYVDYKDFRENFVITNRHGETKEFSKTSFEYNTTKMSEEILKFIVKDKKKYVKKKIKTNQETTQENITTSN